MNLKEKIPNCNILGVKIAAVNMHWTVQFLIDNLSELKGQYICVSNVHTTVYSYENPYFLNIQNSSIIALPDGGPLSKVGKKQGYSNMERVTGPDLMEQIFEKSEERRYSHFFYGSTPETLAKLEINILEKYPDIVIAGTYSPPFRDLSYDENEFVINKINETNPDFIWVGLGAPKQEQWMYDNLNKVNGVMIGVGAGFDYHANNIRRAPKWMQEHSLEWVYRLIQDPKRLFKRYLVTNLKYIWLILFKQKTYSKIKN